MEEALQTAYHARLPRTLLIILSITPAALILAYYLRIVRFAPEPWHRVVLCCATGVAAFFGAGLLEAQMNAIVPRERPWLWSFGSVAPIEEGLKLLAILVGSSPSHYERVSSGLVYGVAVGVGFACVENLYYVIEYGALTGILRGFTAVPSHALQSAIVGLGLGLWQRRRSHGAALFALGLAVGMHGLYDGLLLGAGAMRGLAIGVVVTELLLVAYALRRALEADLRRDMDLLAQVPLLSDLPLASLRLLASGSTRQRFNVGRMVVRQHRPGDALFVIIEGELEVTIDGEIVNTMRAGDFFGEQSVLTGAPRSADVRTTSESRLLRVPQQLLMRAIAENEALAESLTRHGEERFGEGVLPAPAELLARAQTMMAATEVAGLAARLQTVPLLQGLAAQELEALAKACVRVRQGPSRRLVVENRRGPGLYLLLSGAALVKLPRGEVELVEGDFFGEISLLTGWPATATVVSTSPVELVQLRWVDLEPVVARNTGLGLRLLQALWTKAARDAGTTQHSSNRGGALRGSLQPKTESALREAFVELQGLPASAATTLERFVKQGALPEPIDADMIAIAPGGHFAGGPRRGRSR